MRSFLLCCLLLPSIALRAQFWVEHERTTDDVFAARLTPTGERLICGSLFGTMQFGDATLEYNGTGAAIYVGMQEANGTWRWAQKFESSQISGTSLDLAPTGEVVLVVTAGTDALYATTDLAEPTTAVRILHLAPGDGALVGHTSLACGETYVELKVLSDGVLALVAKNDQFGGHITTPDGTVFDTPSESVLLLMEPDGEEILATAASGEAYPDLVVMDDYANGDLLVELTFNDGTCLFLGEAYEEMGTPGSPADDFVLLRIARTGALVWDFATTGSSVDLQYGARSTLSATETFDWLVWATGPVTFGDLTINTSARITLDADGEVVTSQELDMNECMMYQYVPLPAGDALVLGLATGWDSSLGSFVQAEAAEAPFVAHLNADGVWDQAHFFQTSGAARTSLLSVQDGQCLVTGSYEYDLALNGVPFPNVPMQGGFTLLFGESCMATVLDAITPTSCAQLNGGGIAMHVTGGTAPYTWAWTDGGTTAVRTGLTRGLYQATVTDADECSVNTAAYVPGPAAGDGADLFGVFSPWSYFRPDIETTVFVRLGAFGCMPQEARMRVVLDPLVHYVSGLADNDQIHGDTLLLIMDQTVPEGDEPFRTLTLLTDVSAQIDDTVHFQITVLPFEGDPDLANNAFVRSYPVMNSYDPNDKTVTPAGIGEEGYIDTDVEKLDYLIRFQNTGNAPAFNVYIDDTLDTDLDMAGLELMGSSHPMHLEIRDDRTLRFRFDDINLPDSTNDEANSHGYVAYRIPIRPDATHGTVIRNTAHIFFDLNPAVVTNTTVNTLADWVGVDETHTTTTIALAPNPVRNVLTFQSSAARVGDMVRVFDQQGREVLRTMVQGERTTLDVGALANGAYVLRVGTGAARFVKVE